jgi:citrate synthase
MNILFQENYILNVDFYSGIIYRALEFYRYVYCMICYWSFTRLDSTMERNAENRRTKNKIYTGHQEDTDNLFDL